MMDFLIGLLYGLALLATFFDARTDAIKHKSGVLKHGEQVFMVAFYVLYGAVSFWTLTKVSCDWYYTVLMTVGILFLSRMGTFNAVWNKTISKKKKITDVGTTDFLDVHVVGKIPTALRPMFYALCHFVVWCFMGVIEHYLP